MMFLNNWRSPRFPPLGLAALFLGLALMRFVPGPEPGTLIFALGVAIVSSNVLRARPTTPKVATQVMLERISYALLITLTVSVLVGLAAGHPILAIGKSAVPFLVLIWGMLVLAPQMCSNRQMQLLLVLAATLWAVRLIIEGALDYLSGTSLNWLRLTLVNADAVVPFPLIVIPLLLFSKIPMHRGLRNGALLLQLVIVVWSGYRSQQILVAIMIILVLGRMVIQQPLRGSLAALLLSGVTALASFAITNSSEASLLTGQMNRFTSLSQEQEQSGRALERQFAADVFLAYPLLGGGLGVQVPASITYASTEITDTYELPETVSYLHNGPMFLAMSGGLPLTLVYLALWITALITVSSLWVRIAIVALFAFIQVEATFLQVHFNVMLALLMTSQYHKQYSSS